MEAIKNKIILKCIASDFEEEYKVGEEYEFEHSYQNEYLDITNVRNIKFSKHDNIVVLELFKHNFEKSGFIPLKIIFEVASRLTFEKFELELNRYFEGEICGDRIDCNQCIFCEDCGDFDVSNIKNCYHKEFILTLQKWIDEENKKVNENNVAKWIETENETPTENGNFIVAENYPNKSKIRVATWNKNTKYFQSIETGCIIDVIAWLNGNPINIPVYTKREKMTKEKYDELVEKYSYKFTKKEWENSNIFKYNLYYSSKTNGIYIEGKSIAVIGTLFFKSYDDAKEFANYFTNDEALEFIFGIRE